MKFCASAIGLPSNKTAAALTPVSPKSQSSKTRLIPPIQLTPPKEADNTNHDQHFIPRDEIVVAAMPDEAKVEEGNSSVLGFISSKSVVDVGHNDRTNSATCIRQNVDDELSGTCGTNHAIESEFSTTRSPSGHEIVDA